MENKIVQAFRFKQNDPKTKVTLQNIEKINKKSKEVNNTSDFRSRFKQKKNSSLPFENNFDYEDPVIIPLKTREKESFIKERIQSEKNNNKQIPIQSVTLSFACEGNNTSSEFPAIKKTKNTILNEVLPSHINNLNDTLTDFANYSLSLQENNFSSPSFNKPNDSSIGSQNLSKDNRTAVLDNLNLKDKFENTNEIAILDSSEKKLKNQISLKKEVEVNRNELDLNISVQNANYSSSFSNLTESIESRQASKKEVIPDIKINDQALIVNKPSKFPAKHDQKINDQTKAKDVKLKP